MLGKIMQAALSGMAILALPYTASAQCGLIVETEAVAVDQQVPEIHVRLSNSTRNEISLPRIDLPWLVGSIGGLRVYAAMANPPYTQLRFVVPMIHPEGEVVIAPGREISGAVALPDLLPQLREARKRGPIVLFWHFAVRIGDNSCVVRSAQSALIAPL